MGIDVGTSGVKAAVVLPSSSASAWRTRSRSISRPTTRRFRAQQHPATKDLPDEWTRTDEWYAFDKSVRDRGYNVLLTLDESSYANHAIRGKDLRMGEYHPIAWWHCVGQGRVFYSAMGHQASAYTEPEHRKLLLGAVNWALKREGPDCAAPSADAPHTPAAASK